MRCTLLGVAAALTMLACSSDREGDSRRQAFANEFLVSVQHGTDFYKQYCSPEDAKVLHDHVAPRIAGSLVVSHREHYEDGTYELAGTCGDRVRCLVIVVERQGKVERANVLLDPK